MEIGFAETYLRPYKFGMTGSYGKVQNTVEVLVLSEEIQTIINASFD